MKKLLSTSIMKVVFMLLVLLTMGCSYERLTPLKRYHLAALQPLDAIIVPGAPYRNYQLDSVLKGRLLWAWILWKNGVTKNIIFSGGAVYTPFIEAHVMGRYAIELGVPPENIFYDTLAEHSTENIYYSYLLAKQLGFKRVGLATDPFQTFTLNRFLKKRFKSPILSLPFVIDSLSKYNTLQPIISIKGLAQTGTWKSIKERQSFWFRLQGTLGQHIPWKNYPNGQLPAL